MQGNRRLWVVAAACAAAALATAAPALSQEGGLGGEAVCADADLQPSARTLARVERAMLCLINAERRRQGMVPLRRDFRLNRSARFHSRDMVRNGYFAHQRSDRLTLFARIELSRYFEGALYTIYAENLGFGPEPAGTAASLVAEWIRSDSHRVIVLHPELRDIGIGSELTGPSFAFDPLRPSAVYTTDFGRRYKVRPRRCPRRAASGKRRSSTKVRRYCRKRRR